MEEVGPCLQSPHFCMCLSQVVVYNSGPLVRLYIPVPGLLTGAHNSVRAPWGEFRASMSLDGNMGIFTDL